LDEAARRAATATGRAATEAEKARAEDIVAVGAADDGCGAVARACESARGGGDATCESIFDCSANRRIETPRAVRRSWTEKTREATWGSSLELANHGRERHRKKALRRKRKIFLYVSRDDDAFAILCSEGGVDTTPFKR
jgi:hypothetical protein